MVSVTENVRPGACEQPTWERGTRRPPRRWARFFAGLTLILLFAFVAVPGLQRLGPAQEVREAIQRSGVDATALFYTESDASCEAEMTIRDTLRY